MLFLGQGTSLPKKEHFCDVRVAYDVRYWPDGVYPGEVREACPEAQPTIDTLITRLRSDGPKPLGFPTKNLGAKVGGLWQINLKFNRRQIRVLYAPYGNLIVLFHIHKKSSPQEQHRAYGKAMARKAEYEERSRRDKAKANGRDRTLH